MPQRLMTWLEVYVYVGKIGNKSLRLNSKSTENKNPRLIAKAHFVLVAVQRVRLKLSQCLRF